MKKIVPWLGGLIALLIYVRLEPLLSSADVDIGKIHAENGVRARLRAAAIPAGFTVPDSFADAVALLESLTGSTAKPFVIEMDDNPPRPTRGLAFTAKTDSLAHAIADSAAVLFRAKGFSLFAYEARFEGGPGNLVLMPDREPYAAIEAIGTSSGMGSPDAKAIVRWLTALQSDQPFVLNRIGHDFVEGRFTTPITDAGTLAKRLFAFCPDIVHQGTRSVANLAVEIRESNVLYCWWD